MIVLCCLSVCTQGREHGREDKKPTTVRLELRPKSFPFWLTLFSGVNALGLEGISYSIIEKVHDILYMHVSRALSND